jgi:hypothetical protein
MLIIIQFYIENNRIVMKWVKWEKPDCDEMGFRHTKPIAGRRRPLRCRKGAIVANDRSSPERSII